MAVRLADASRATFNGDVMLHILKNDSLCGALGSWSANLRFIAALGAVGLFCSTPATAQVSVKDKHLNQKAFDSTSDLKLNGDMEERDPETIYRNVCAACHANGVNGAPRLGNSAAWQARLQPGIEILVKHTIDGYRGSPPKGGCKNCTDAELRATLRYILSQSIR